MPESRSRGWPSADRGLYRDGDAGSARRYIAALLGLHEPQVLVAGFDRPTGWVDASIAAGLLVVSKVQYRTLRLTDDGREVMRGRRQTFDIRRPGRLTGLAGLRRDHPDLPDELHAYLRIRRATTRHARGRFEHDRG